MLRIINLMINTDTYFIYTDTYIKINYLHKLLLFIHIIRYKNSYKNKCIVSADTSIDCSYFHSSRARLEQPRVLPPLPSLPKSFKLRFT